MVLWKEDDSVSVIPGKMIVTPADSADRTVGAMCTVKTSAKGPHHSARIADCGECFATKCLGIYIHVLCACVHFIHVHVHVYTVGTRREMNSLEEQYIAGVYSPFESSPSTCMKSLSTPTQDVPCNDENSVPGSLTEEQDPPLKKPRKTMGKSCQLCTCAYYTCTCT